MTFKVGDKVHVEFDAFVTWIEDGEVTLEDSTSVVDVQLPYMSDGVKITKIIPPFPQTPGTIIVSPSLGFSYCRMGNRWVSVEGQIPLDLSITPSFDDGWKVLYDAGA